MTNTYPDGQPVQTVRPVAVDERPPAASAGLRIFQVASAIAGGILFAFGLIAIFGVDFNANLLDTTTEVAEFGFSAAAAIAAILLGGVILVATLADQDRGSAAFAGLLTLGAGIAALIFDGQSDTEIQVDNRSAGLFIIIGAVVFVMSLVPWWSRRRVVSVQR